MKRSVEIAGAGLAGLTAGLAFAQKGWRVRVHEQSPMLRTFGAGVELWENGLRVLDALGVLAPVIAGNVAISRQARRNPDGKIFSSSDFGPGFRLYVPPHETLVRTLHDALVETGGEVVFNSRAVTAEPEGRLHLAAGRARHADLVIGADGTHSAIRDSLGLLKWRRSAQQFGYRAMVRCDPSRFEAEGEATHCEYWSGSRRVLYAPATASLVSVQLISLAGDDRRNAVPIDRRSWQNCFPDLSWIIDRLPEDGRGEWFEIVRPECWSEGRVAIIGDAATAQTPFLGHGAGCAMMSAFALAQTIDRTGDMAAGLAEWELRERPFIDWVQWVGYRYGQLAFLPAVARNWAFRAIDASGWLRRQILLAAVRRDVTAARRYSPFPPPNLPVYPLMH